MDKPGDEAAKSTAEVYKLAHSLLRQHGRDAVIIANMRAGEFLISGDLDSYRTWKRLVMLVDGMTDQETSNEMPVH